MGMHGHAWVCQPPHMSIQAVLTQTASAHKGGLPASLCYSHWQQYMSRSKHAAEPTVPFAAAVRCCAAAWLILARLSMPITAAADRRRSNQSALVLCPIVAASSAAVAGPDSSASGIPRLTMLNSTCGHQTGHGFESMRRLHNRSGKPHKAVNANAPPSLSLRLGTG